jgi:hypothetical protein
MDVHSRIRRAFLLLIPAAFTARSAPPDDAFPPQNPQTSDDPRLPNGKKQQDEILKADYQKNLKDAQEMTSLARSFEEDLEKDEQYVYSLSQLKKLDDIEKLTKRIRSRLKRY